MSAGCDAKDAELVSPTPATRPRRTQPELLAEYVFRPVGGLLVRLLLPLRVAPPAVVVANGVSGLVGVYLLARGQLVGAAALLQLKTLLDNVDGQLARRSGRMSALGRYLDTEIDLLVNLVLFTVLGHVTGEWVLAAAALAALTLLLSSDFNEDVLYRRARGETVVTEPSTTGESKVACLLAGIYRVVFSPQDRLLQSFAGRRLERLLGGVSDPVLRARATLEYHDEATTAVLANLGLSTQLAVLGVFLVLGEPEAYLWLVLAQLAVLPLLQVRRERRVRRLLGQ